MSEGSPARRKRCAIDGVLLIDKPTEISSAQVVGKVKWLLQCEKIGHAGTLDPGASGLLVCLLGRATRLAAHAEAGIKTYSGSVELGLTTSTDDISGEVLSRSPISVTREDIERVAASFVGSIQQVPPKVSALKVGGKRAYALTRQGVDVELAPRRITVYELHIKNVEVTGFDFVCVCSKGTYIRSLARDIGAKLGCGGTLKSLRRELSQPFSVAHATRLDGDLTAAILPWFELFPKTPRVGLSPDEARGVWNGDLRPLRRVPPPAAGEEAAVYGIVGGEPMGLIGWNGSGWRIVVNVTGPGEEKRSNREKGD